MTPEDVLAMFRQHAAAVALDTQDPKLSYVIQDLAQLLAESRGRLPKETFEALVRIGGVLYSEGNSQYQAKSDVDAIMKKSTRD